MPDSEIYNLTFHLFLQGHDWPPNNDMSVFFPIFLNIFIHSSFIIGHRGSENQINLEEITGWECYGRDRVDL